MAEEISEGPEGYEEEETTNIPSHDDGEGVGEGRGAKTKANISGVRVSPKTNHKIQDMNQLATDFADMSTDERLWYLFRRQLRVYRAINNLLGLDPDNAEIPWATQVELAGLIKDAREVKDRAARKREQRATTFTNVLRYVLGGIGLAFALKVVDLVVSHIPAFTAVPGK